MSQLAGPDWVTTMLRRASRLPEEVRSRLYLALPNEPGTWEVVDKDAASVADQFWQSVRLLTASPEHAIEFAEKLLNHDRPWSAVVFLAQHSHRPGSEIPLTLIERTLRAAASPDNVSRSRPALSTTTSVSCLTVLKPLVAQPTPWSNSSTYTSRLFSTHVSRTLSSVHWLLSRNFSLTWFVLPSGEPMNRRRTNLLRVKQSGSTSFCNPPRVAPASWSQ